MIVETTCPECDGAGYSTGSDHGCNGTDEDCNITCPVPIQMQCEVCEGEGTVEVYEN